MLIPPANEASIRISNFRTTKNFQRMVIVSNENERSGKALLVKQPATLAIDVGIMGPASRHGANNRSLQMWDAAIVC